MCVCIIIPQDGFLPLEVASQGGRLKTVEYLISHGAVVNSQNQVRYYTIASLPSLFTSRKMEKLRIRLVITQYCLLLEKYAMM